MTAAYKEFKVALLSLKETLSKLIAYPGNQVYKKHLEERTLNVDFTFKKLKTQLEKSINDKITDILVQMAIQDQIIQGISNSSQQRLDSIKNLERLCNSLEIYLDEGLADADDLFSPSLQALLGKAFEIEYKDLKLVYSKSGTCTAFLLRKILEKSAYLALTKLGKTNELVDSEGKSKGLQTLLDICTRERVNGHPLLTSKTRTMIQGIKFLGDSAAHNPLAIVDMHEITPQLPFVTTALKEIGHSISEAK